MVYAYDKSERAYNPSEKSFLNNVSAYIGVTGLETWVRVMHQLCYSDYAIIFFLFDTIFSNLLDIHG